jgi:hypothetical protein
MERATAGARWGRTPEEFSDCSQGPGLSLALDMHLFNHQTHHRGQGHALITRPGESTGDMDLPFVLPD